jgi:ATP-dependent Clp protease protease subunit
MISNSEPKGAKILKKIDEFNASDRIQLKLLEHSHHYLNGEINEDSVGECIKWLIYESLDSGKQKVLTLYINSTGGDLYQAFGLIDVMQSNPHVIRCIGIGAVMSAAFLVFASGTKGQRYSAKNTSFMSHQFSESMDSKYHDLRATMKESDICNERMVSILKDATGLAPSVIKKRLLPASDVYLTAEETVEIGIADHLLS